MWTFSTPKEEREMGFATAPFFPLGLQLSTSGECLESTGEIVVVKETHKSSDER